MSYRESFLKNLDSKDDSQLTIKNYGFDLNKFYSYIQSVKNIKVIEDEQAFLKSISLLDLEEYRNHLNKNGGRDGAGEAANTINRRITTLKSYFKYLKKHKIIESNIAEDLGFVKGGKRNTIYLKKDEAEELLSASSSSNVNQRKVTYSTKRNYLIIRIYLKYGLRNTELINLIDSDFNCSNNELRVIGKGNKERVLFLNNEDIELFKEYIEIRDKQLTKNSDKTFLSNNGNKLDITNIGRILKKCLDNADIAQEKKDKITPHKLRHTSATLAMKDGVPIEIISKILGHADTSITSRIYVHIDDEDIKKGCEQISSMYS